MSLDLPNLEVITAVTGIEVPGNPYSFSCTVTVVDRLIVSPAIKWSKKAVSFISAKNYISVYPIRYEDQLFLEFEFLNTSDAGKYTCEATVTISEISLNVTNSSVEVLQLQSEYSIHAIIFEHRKHSALFMHQLLKNSIPMSAYHKDHAYLYTVILLLSSGL